MRKFLITILAFVLVALPSCTEGGAEVYTAYGTAMDTNVTVTVYGGDSSAVADGCLELLYNLEAEFSVTASGSKLYRLNQGDTVKDEGHFYTVCGLANEINLLTDGAYDPCVYPIVKLWGFTTGEYKVPDKDELSAALKLVKESDISFTENGISISGGGMADLGGIAKGYAAEVLKSYIKESGAESAVISLGGNILTVGVKPDGTRWNIGISSPKNNGKLLGTLKVEECAVVTSGSYLRNFEQDGKIYHHIIDPASGMPADNGLVSVTVVADDSALADGLSTAFFVMGIEKSMALAKEVGAETIFVTESEIYVSDGLKEKFTPDASVEGVYKVIYN